MIITRKNALGGRPISKFPIGVDPDTGYYGYKVGYCSCGCNKALYFRSIDVSEIIGHFGVREEREALTTKVRNKLICMLGGRIGDN